MSSKHPGRHRRTPVGQCRTVPPWASGSGWRPSSAWCCPAVPAMFRAAVGMCRTATCAWQAAWSYPYGHGAATLNLAWRARCRQAAARRRSARPRCTLRTTRSEGGTVAPSLGRHAGGAGDLSQHAARPGDVAWHYGPAPTIFPPLPVAALCPWPGGATSCTSRPPYTTFFWQEGPILMAHHLGAATPAGDDHCAGGLRWARDLDIIRRRARSRVRPTFPMTIAACFGGACLARPA